MTLVEVCAGGVSDAMRAAQCGAHRIELCAALELGGLTPSLGVLRQTLDRQPLPIAAMNRPRAGGFCYQQAEFAAMLSDAQTLVEAGAAAVVFGVLLPDGRIDLPRTEQMCAAIGPGTAVFHRAFDFVPDQAEALEQLIAAGVGRVLTSGGAPTALAGIEAIARLVLQAQGRIEILPGAGIDANNVVRIAQATQAGQVHLGVSGPGNDTSVDANPAIPLDDSRWLGGGGFRRVDGDRLAAVMDQLRA